LLLQFGDVIVPNQLRRRSI